MSTTSDREEAKARALKALAEMTDEEDAALTAAANADPDAPVMDDATAARLRPATEVAPELVRRQRGQRGPGRKPAKVLVPLRLEPDVVEAWRKTGAGWQTRMGEALKRVIGQ
jgi:uncharacterized protein (DUF4415 family)